MSSFNYYPNIPQATDVLADSQGEILTNFQSIGSWTNVDHYSFQTGTDGEHKQVTIPTPQTAPVVTGSEGEITTQTVSSKSELFYTNATSNVQITNTSLTPSSGSGMLPGGLQIRSGSGSSNGSGVTNTFSSAFPNACVAVTVTGTNPSQLSNSFHVSSVGSSSFKCSSSLGEGILYIAIGY